MMGINLSKKEIAVTVILLLVLFVSAFFISGALAIKRNRAVAVSNIETETLSKESIALANDVEAYKREEINISKRLAREGRKLKAEEEIRKAEELARAQAQQNSNEGKVAYQLSREI